MAHIEPVEMKISSSNKRHAGWRIPFIYLVAYMFLLAPSRAQPTWKARKKSKGHSPAAPTQLEYAAPAQLQFNPSGSPAIAPLAEPDRSPTVEPTASPLDTVTPTVMAPLAEPDRSPTVEPTASPLDTVTPTVPPSDFPLVQLRADDVELTIGGIVLPLSPSSQDIAESIISDSMAYSIVDVLGFDQIQNLDILVMLTTGSRQRKLVGDDGGGGETISFDAVIEIQSIVTIHDVDRYTIGAFNDPVEQGLFLQALQETGDVAFANVSSLHVGHAKVQSHDTDGADAGESSSKNTAAVAASLLAIAAVGVFAAVAVYLFYVRGQSKKTVETKHHQSSTSGLVKLERRSVSTDGSVPSEISLSISAESSVTEQAQRKSTIAPSDESCEKDRIVDTMSDLSRLSSMEYDFDDIFHVTDADPLAITTSSVTSKHKSSDTVIEAARSQETNLLDEDGTTIESGSDT